MSEESKPLSTRHQTVLDNYLMCWSQTEAYKVAYPSASHTSAKASAARLFADVNFQGHLRARLDEMHMSADEALARETEIGRVGVGFFFKIVDEWMFNPLPEYEILDMREVIDDTKDPPEKQINYRVRHAVLDMDKVIDPRYAHLIKKFSNSRRTGLSIEMYDGQAAHRDVLKMAGKFVEKHELTGKDGEALIPPIPPEQIAQRVASLLELAKKRKDESGS
jgi:hypothetical protein